MASENSSEKNKMYKANYIIKKELDGNKSIEISAEFVFDEGVAEINKESIRNRINNEQYSNNLKDYIEGKTKTYLKNKLIRINILRQKYVRMSLMSQVDTAIIKPFIFDLGFELKIKAKDARFSSIEEIINLDELDKFIRTGKIEPQKELKIGELTPI